jgi:cobalamin biosynthesis protein CobT
MKSKLKGLDNDPNSIFRASRTIRNVINKKLKKEQEKQNAQARQQTLTTPPTSNTENDVNKNLTLFSLHIRQTNTLLKSFNSQISDDVKATSNEIAENKFKKVQKRERRKQLINRVGIEPEESESEGESGSEEDSDAGSEEDSDAGSEEDSDAGSSFENSGNTGNIISDDILSNAYVKDINKILLIIDNAIVVWDDNIKPNIRYLGKIKLRNFLNSKLMEDLNKNFDIFSDNLRTFSEYAKTLSKDERSGWTSIEASGEQLINKFDELFFTINDDIKRLAGEGTGIINGAGFLHIPTPYNSYLKESSKKYLM